MALTLGSNTAAGKAVRQVGSTTNQLARVSERMSSGLRIIRGSDDAAGLAISSALDRDSRVYSQAIRNANDAISAISIADGTLEQTADIIMRMKELAEQSANGSFSRSQRLSLDKEGAALSAEFNRLVSSTSFNGLNMLNGAFGRLNIQLGYGTSGSIGVDIGSGLSRRVTNSLYNGSQVGVSPGALSMQHAAADFNGDGKMDLVSADPVDGIFVALGNGDGSFKSSVQANAIAAYTVAVGDINNDSKIDIISGDGATLIINLGNGDGTFKTTGAKNASGSIDSETFLGDFNGDGNLDIVGGSTSGVSAHVFFGNGNGTFKSEVVLSLGANFSAMAVGDMNNDGRDDLQVVASDGNAFVYQGSQSGLNYLGALEGFKTGVESSELVDMDFDGILDLVVASGSGARIAKGNGDGTFKTSTSVSVGGGIVNALRVGDINGDGIPDVVAETGGSISYASGNGDGTFGSSQTLVSGSTTGLQLWTADFNGDGATDVTLSTAGAGEDVTLFLGNTSASTSLQRINLTTQGQALSAIAVLDQALARISTERGLLGAGQSRISSALNTLQSLRENSAAARSRIVDADIAQEAASLARLRILQDAGAAVLAQANQLPALALTLL